MVIVGVVGATQIYNLNKLESEQIAILLLSDLVYQLPAISWLIALFFGAALAAIMSTVDSALLAISSIITKDIREWKTMKINIDKQPSIFLIS